MWSFSRGTINKEKVVFAVAVGWLCLMGVRFNDAPRTEDWGPPRTSVYPAPLKPHYFDLSFESDAIESGRVCDRCGYDGAEEADPRGGKDSGNGGRGSRRGADRGKDRGKERTDPSGKADETGGRVPDGAELPPPRYVGTVKVGHRDRWIIFADEQDTRYFSFPLGAGPLVPRRRRSPRLR